MSISDGLNHPLLGQPADKLVEIIYHKNERITEQGQTIRELSDAIFKAHGAGLPANWVYTDAQTTLDLLVAECKTAQTERNTIREQCAKIAEQFGESDGMKRAGKLIAAAIRSGSAKS